MCLTTPAFLKLRLFVTPSVSDTHNDEVQSLDVRKDSGNSSIASCGPSTFSILTQQPHPFSSETNVN